MKKLLLFLVILLLAGCDTESKEQLQNLEVSVDNFHTVDYNDYYFLYVDVEVTNPNEEAIEFDYYFRVDTPGTNTISETNLYTNDNACSNYYKEDITGTVNCKAVFEIVVSGDYTFKMYKAKLLDYELIGSTEFTIDDKGNITFN